MRHAALSDNLTADMGLGANRRRSVAAAAALLSLLAAGVSGCGSSSAGGTQTTTATTSVAAGTLSPLRLCLDRHGYTITPDTAAQLATAPRNFAFTDVWNLLNPDRVAVSLTFSRSVEGATRAAAWTRKANARIGKGLVKAPVVRFGKVNVLWTAEPRPIDTADIYGCIRRS